MTIDLYLATLSPPCRAVQMAARIMGIDLNLKHIDFHAGEHMKPEFMKMNPQHCVPTIEDDGFILWDSHAIMTYLAAKYAPDTSLYSKDIQKKAVIDRLMYFEGSVLFPALVPVVKTKLFAGQVPSPEQVENLKKAIGTLENLITGPYFAGDHITFADISIYATTTIIELLDHSKFKGEHPKLVAWYEKMKLEVPDNKGINEVPINEFRARQEKEAEK